LASQKLLKLAVAYRFAADHYSGMVQVEVLMLKILLMKKNSE
jgi:hypothetical protein